MTIEDRIARIEREYGMRPGSAWRRNSEGLRYLPWDLFQTCGFVLKVNENIGGDGIQMCEVYEDVPSPSSGLPTTSVGFDIQGDSIGPWLPDPESDPVIRRSWWAYKEVSQPPAPYDFDTGRDRFRHG